MRAILRVAVAAGVVAILGCTFWRPNVVPMAQRFDAAPCAAADGRALPLLVLLPGRFMPADAFIQQGYLRAVRESGFAVDVLIVDAHIGYYSDRSILDRLRADVFEPARRRGVSDIWIAGISVGAFGAMLYADSYPGELAGLIAIGPFLGGEDTSAAIRAAGGLRQWQVPLNLPPLTVESSETETELHAWRWLRGQVRATQSGEYPPLYLAFGEGDRYRYAQRLLADALPPQQVLVVGGDHDWNAWRPAWRQLLERLPIERRAECKAVVAALPSPAEQP